VRAPEPGDKKAVQEGSYANLKGRLEGDPVTVVWTQRIRDGEFGFAINAPNFDMADALRAQFPRTSISSAPSPSPDPDGLPVY